MQANFKGDNEKQVKVWNVYGRKNPQKGKGKELNKEGKANFKKNNTPKIKYKEQVGVVIKVTVSAKEVPVEEKKKRNYDETFNF